MFSKLETLSMNRTQFFLPINYPVAAKCSLKIVKMNGSRLWEERMWWCRRTTCRSPLRSVRIWWLPARRTPECLPWRKSTSRSRVGERTRSPRFSSRTTLDERKRCFPAEKKKQFLPWAFQIRDIRNSGLQRCYAGHVWESMFRLTSELLY